MNNQQTLAEEQRETADELSLTLQLAQRMAQRLSDETHGVLYNDVVAITRLLHESRLKIDTIQHNIVVMPSNTGQ
jgi:hypothetical protein